MNLGFVVSQQNFFMKYYSPFYGLFGILSVAIAVGGLLHNIWLKLYFVYKEATLRSVCIVYHDNSLITFGEELVAG